MLHGRPAHSQASVHRVAAHGCMDGCDACGHKCGHIMNACTHVYHRNAQERLGRPERCALLEKAADVLSAALRATAVERVLGARVPIVKWVLCASAGLLLRRALRGHSWGMLMGLFPMWPGIAAEGEMMWASKVGARARTSRDKGQIMLGLCAWHCPQAAGAGRRGGGRVLRVPRGRHQAPAGGVAGAADPAGQAAVPAGGWAG